MCLEDSNGLDRVVRKAINTNQFTVKLGLQMNMFHSTMIIISLFTLGSIYSTYDSGAEQMTETNNSNQT